MDECENARVDIPWAMRNVETISVKCELKALIIKCEFVKTNTNYRKNM